jgi:hypothetical protein
MAMLSRRKGATWECEVARLWGEAIGQKVVRGLGQARNASEVPDVDAPGWWPECKSMVKCNPEAALAQAELAALGARPTGRIPIAVCKDTRKVPFVMLRLEGLVRISTGSARCTEPDAVVRLPLSAWLELLRKDATR